MSSRQIATSTMWQLGSQVTMAAMSILTVKFVAIGLSKELAGNYNSAYGFLQLFGILADFGLYAVAVREVAKARDKAAVMGALIVLRVIILVGSLALAIVFVWLLPQWRGTPFPLSVLIASLVPFFTLLAGILRTVFQVNYKMHYVFIAEVTQRIITVAMIGFFIWLGIRGSHDLQHLHMFLFIGGIGAFVLFLMSFVYGNKLMPIRLSVDKSLMKDLAKKAAPYGAAFLFMALYRQFDVTMIALLRPDFEIQNAYYGFVVRMVDMGFLIPTFLLNSTLPILSERHDKGEDTAGLLGKTIVSLLLIGSVAALFSFFWARPLIQLLTTEAYLSTATLIGSDSALRLMAVPLFLNSVILYGFYVLLTKHQWKQLVVTLGLAAVISLISNWILIPKLGFMGAAQTMIITHVVLAILLIPQGLKAMPVRVPVHLLGRWLLFSLILGGLLYASASSLQTELNTLWGLIMMTIFMGLLLFVLKMPKHLQS